MGDKMIMDAQPLVEKYLRNVLRSIVASNPDLKEFSEEEISQVEWCLIDDSKMRRLVESLRLDSDLELFPESCYYRGKMVRAKCEAWLWGKRVELVKLVNWI